MRTERRDHLPVVRQIYPINSSEGLPLLQYVVQTLEDGYFSSRQKELLKAKLQEKLKTQTVSIKGSGSDITVTSTPCDSTAGRFALLEALQEITNPQTPFSALGILCSSSFNVTSYVVELQLLGTHSEASLARIQQVLNEVVDIESALCEPDRPQVFSIVVKGNWAQASTKLLRNLIDYGFGVGLHVDSRR